MSKHRKKRMPLSPADKATIAAAVITAPTSPLSLVVSFVEGNDTPEVVIQFQLQPEAGRHLPATVIPASSNACDLGH